MVKLTISILVHEDFSYIHNALASILGTTQTPHEIYVVINAGNREQIGLLQSAFPQLHYVINDQPQGFAANHNLVMRLAQSPYIALLNDDILLQGSVLDQLVKYLDAHPDVGMIGPQLEYEDGEPQVTAYSDPSLVRVIYKISGLSRLTNQRSRLRKWLIAVGVSRLFKTESLSTSSLTRDVEVLKAAAIIVRKDTIDEAGLIDESTKAYGEEIDWDLRIRKKGWRIVLVPEARITHFGIGQATLSLNGWQIVEDRKGILNYFIKNRAFWEQIVIRMAILILHTLQSCLAMLISWKNIGPHIRTAFMALTWQGPDEMKK